MSATLTRKYWLSPSIEFKLQDCWIGWFWEWKGGIDNKYATVRYLHIYICILPCLPIHLKLMEYTTHAE